MTINATSTVYNFNCSTNNIIIHCGLFTRHMVTWLLEVCTVSRLLSPQIPFSVFSRTPDQSYHTTRNYSTAPCCEFVFLCEHSIDISHCPDPDVSQRYFTWILLISVHSYVRAHTHTHTHTHTQAHT